MSITTLWMCVYCPGWTPGVCVHLKFLCNLLLKSEVLLGFSRLVSPSRVCNFYLGHFWRFFFSWVAGPLAFNWWTFLGRLLLLLLIWGLIYNFGEKKIHNFKDSSSQRKLSGGHKRYLYWNLLWIDAVYRTVNPHGWESFLVTSLQTVLCEVSALDGGPCR